MLPLVPHPRVGTPLAEHRDGSRDSGDRKSASPVTSAQFVLTSVS
jgi:hypothetical protein